MEKRIKELDVLRVFAMLFVITYHFGMEYGSRNLPYFNFFCETPNYDFGNVAVTIFIVLSGGMLYKKYRDFGFENASPQGKITLKNFYLKRAKAIYPPFWIMNLYVVFALIRHFISDGSPFYAGNPAKLLLTVAGLDGYLQMFGLETYYFSGEWFVGAIVVLYCLYPLLAKAYRRKPTLLTFALVLLYGGQFLLPRESLELISIYLPTILLKFTLGFVLLNHLPWLRAKAVLIASVVLLAVLTFVDIPGVLNKDFFGTVAALCWFVLLLNMAPFILKFKTVEKSIGKMASLSYCVFLVQHVAIVWMLILFAKVFEKMDWVINAPISLVLLAVTFVVILGVAWILNKVSKWTLKILSPKKAA